MKNKILATTILAMFCSINMIAFAACTGTCESTASCAAKGGVSTPGLCPGAADIQCCTSISNSGSTNANNSNAVNTNNTGSTNSSNQTTNTSVEIPNPLKVNTIADLIDNVLTYIMALATLLLPLAVIYSAYLMLTSEGEPENFLTAKKALLYTVVGYMLILISKGIAAEVAKLLGSK